MEDMVDKLFVEYEKILEKKKNYKAKEMDNSSMNQGSRGDLDEPPPPYSSSSFSSSSPHYYHSNHHHYIIQAENVELRRLLQE